MPRSGLPGFWLEKAERPYRDRHPWLLSLRRPVTMEEAEAWDSYAKDFFHLGFQIA